MLIMPRDPHPDSYALQAVGSFSRKAFTRIRICHTTPIASGLRLPRMGPVGINDGRSKGVRRRSVSPEHAAPALGLQATATGRDTFAASAIAGVLGLDRPGCHSYMGRQAAIAALGLYGPSESSAFEPFCYAEHSEPSLVRY